MLRVDEYVGKKLFYFYSVFSAGAIDRERRWLSRFKEGNFDLKNMSHSRRPSNLDQDHLNATRELVNIMDYVRSFNRCSTFEPWVSFKR